MDRFQNETDFLSLRTSLLLLRQPVVEAIDGRSFGNVFSPWASPVTLLSIELQAVASGERTNLDPRFRKLLIDILRFDPRHSASGVDAIDVVHEVSGGKISLSNFHRRLSDKLPTYGDFQDNDRFVEAMFSALAAMMPGHEGGFDADQLDALRLALVGDGLFKRTGPAVGEHDPRIQAIISQPGFKLGPDGRPLTPSQIIEKMFRVMSEAAPPEVARELDAVRRMQSDCPGSIVVNGLLMLPKTAEERRNTPAADIQRDPRLAEYKPCP